MREKTGKDSRNVSMFAQMISKGREKPIVQQRLDKIFDEKNPSTVAIDIVEAIILRFPDIDAYTLITGKEKSGSQEKPDQQLLTQLRKEIDVLKASLLRLSDLVPSVQEESLDQEVTYDPKASDKTRSTGKP